jgi:anti-sigma regulatory factor (Ser/Thr protein kinase)
MTRRTGLMATVELRFSALPAHVRTARLVAASVARRSGVDEALLDEVRLAVGEACSRAVGLHRRSGVDAPVEMLLRDDADRFSVEVSDAVPAAEGGDPGEPPGMPDPASLIRAVEQDSLDSTLGLAVITGLVDDVEIRSGARGGVVRMSWPSLAR